MRFLLVLVVLLVRTDCWGFSPDVYLRAAAATGVPVELLLAISHVESGFQPHALNVSGRSFFPSSRYEALGILKRSSDNVDIGLMQVNWGLWGKRFDLSKFELLDPLLNVVAGAKILEHCIRVSRSWRKGVGLYHSQKYLRQRDYIEKVWRSYRRVLTKTRQ
jgi:transglycosylase-like protein with SLT domain